MWCNPIVVVALVALLADVASVSAKSKARPIIQVPTKRLLRTDEWYTEDRGFSLSKLAEGFSAAKSNFKLSRKIQALQKQGYNVQDMASFLLLGANVNNVLTHPNMGAMAKYIRKLNKLNNKRGSKDPIRMYDVLAKHFDEVELSKVLVSANARQDRGEWAIKLQGEQVAGWLKHESPKTVFERLKLNDASTHPFQTRNLKAWQHYVDILAKRSPDNKTTKFEMFRHFYKDQGLAKLINESKTSDDMIKSLKFDLFAKWTADSVNSKNIYRKVFGVRKNDVKDNAIINRIVSDFNFFVSHGNLRELS